MQDVFGNHIVGFLMTGLKCIQTVINKSDIADAFKMIPIETHEKYIPRIFDMFTVI